MKKIPYGISDFAQLPTENYIYVDRSNYIEKLEELGSKYIFLMRPRRFGKSLFVSLLHYYYGLEHKDKFQKLFSQYYIGQHPTPLANTYAILRFEFSRINTETKESTLEGFLARVTEGIQLCMRNYNLFAEKEQQEILAQSEPAICMTRFFNYWKLTPNLPKIYILIDEYDHFANELLAFDFNTFQNTVTRNGFVRKFYETIKTATGEGVVDRLFVTGVTPITLDSLTSGFNIATNLTTNEDFAECMGFTESEVYDIMPNLTEQAKEDVRNWYNGYRFSPIQENKIYNPDMVLYFAKTYLSKNQYPMTLLDVNIASDYSKIGRLLKIGSADHNFEVLEQLIHDQSIESELTDQFSFERPFDKKDFASLLYYMGLLTMQNAVGRWINFTMPNYVMKELYYQLMLRKLQERDSFELDTTSLQKAIRSMAFENDIDPFIAEMEKVLTALSNRDYQRFDEKYIKLVLMMLVIYSKQFSLISEREVAGKYVDVLLEYRAPAILNYNFVFEIKYLKAGDETALADCQATARKQLTDYTQTPELQKIPDLKAYTLVVIKDKIYKETIL